MALLEDETSSKSSLINEYTLYTNKSPSMLRDSESRRLANKMKTTENT